MRKTIAKYLLVLFIVFITMSASPQPNFNDSIEAYNYWGKRGIIEVVYSYMQDYLETHPNASADKRGMEAYCEKFIKGVDSKSKVDIDNDFKELNDFLSNNSWATTAKKMVSPLGERLEKKQELDIYLFTIFETNSHSYLQVVQNIVTNYTQSVQKFQALNPVNDTANGAEISPSTPELPRDKALIDYQWLIPAFIFGLVLGILFLYYYSKHKVLFILNSEKHEYNRILKEKGSNPLFFKFLSFIEILKNKKNEYKSSSEKKISEEQFGLLNQEIADLKSKNIELVEENIELGFIIENLKLKRTSGNNEINNQDESPNIKKTLFFSIPEVDGTFKTESAKDFKEQDSFYKVELITNTNGNISFLSGDFDLRAIENIDYYLNPVCEIQNIANRAFAKKVVMIDHGTIVQKRDDLWQIINKIKIKLV